MPRPRTPIDFEETVAAYRYFKEALESPQRSDAILVDDTLAGRTAAKYSLAKMRSVSYCPVPERHIAKQTAYDADELNAWVDEHITQQGWKRYKNNQKQKAHAKRTRGEKSGLKLSRRNRTGLNRIIDDGHATTLDDAIAYLLDRYDKG